LLSHVVNECRYVEVQFEWSKAEPEYKMGAVRRVPMPPGGADKLPTFRKTTG
jgi:hypothetical protein